MVFAINVEVTARVHGCGDGIVDINEQCDGNPVVHNSCTNLGFTTGNLACTNACNYDTSSCTVVLNTDIVPTGSGSSYVDQYIQKQASNLTQDGLARLKIPKNSVIFEGTTEPWTEVVLSNNDGTSSRTMSGSDGKYRIAAVNLRSRDSIFTLTSGREEKRFIVNMFSDSVVKYNNVSLQSKIRLKILKIVSEYQKKWKVDFTKNQTKLISNR